MRYISLINMSKRIELTECVCSFQISFLSKLSFKETSSNRANIRLEEVSLNESLERNDIWKEQTHSVSSMRLDILIKEIYRISRSKAAQLIKREQVKVNFKTVSDQAMTVLEADLISVRGYGRSRIIEIGGMSRKNKTFVTSAVLKT